MVNWQTISSLATAGGTLVLALATFSAVRSSNRSARVAEESLLAGLRPLLIPSLSGDPTHKALWGDDHVALVEGGRAVVEQVGDVVYLAMGLRNVGSGIGVLHGWYVMPHAPFSSEPHADPVDFRRLAIDLYVPSGGSGYWESAVRQPDDPFRDEVEKALSDRQAFRIDLLYGDQHGRQRTISRFVVRPFGEGDGWYCQAANHWRIDGPAPR